MGLESLYLGLGYDTNSDKGDSQSLDEDGWGGNLDNDLPAGPLDGHAAESIHLLFPSALGLQRCRDDSLKWLVEQEMQLRMGQVNNALHKLHLALADKAMLFHTDARHSSSQATSSRAWGQVMAINVMVNKFTKIYRASCQAMVTLSASNDILAQYQALSKDHLKISGAVAKPNARGHRNDTLPWFWSMDTTRNAKANDWMMEFYQVHWLQSKALKDQWEEELELIHSEARWTSNFFDFKACFWENMEDSMGDGATHQGQACYAARQSIIYRRLRDHCHNMFDQDVFL
ncbi:hypothetical protein PAXRUDRAFT_173297 [Paxillus rubicundulus Ve08.2h10]|uniref:Uncharacterized protein n=1 Tax=Paxillus rubicundulus Ve08.2h10 TaxID=930991 RepID=A0A0D0CW09_9AGAM|nr:hypothetical protein PAXRUDRAFT_173297 [Paxillus rubicundulus Ve08.2h10]